jgi:hypothetical protein
LHFNDLNYFSGSKIFNGLNVLNVRSYREVLMPEQITKYPDVTLQVLREAGAVCGKGAPQKILKQCPADRFCSLATGEMCIYGIKDIPRMTQIAPAELAQVVCPLTPKGASFAAGFSGLEAAMIGAVFLGGLAVGKVWRNRA